MMNIGSKTPSLKPRLRLPYVHHCLLVYCKVLDVKKLIKDVFISNNPNIKNQNYIKVHICIRYEIEEKQLIVWLIIMF